jgi:hypothetical protein
MRRLDLPILGRNTFNDTEEGVVFPSRHRFSRPVNVQTVPVAPKRRILRSFPGESRGSGFCTRAGQPSETGNFLRSASWMATSVEARHFYEGNYDILLETYSKKPERLIPDIINRAVCEYLRNSTDPTEQFDIAEKMILADCSTQDSWPVHPSWPALAFNRARYYYQGDDPTNCAEQLSAIWSHQPCIDPFLLVSASLLTIELSIGYRICDNLENARNYLAKVFPNPGVMAGFFKSRCVTPQLQQWLVERSTHARSRSDVSQAVLVQTEASQTALRDLLLSYERQVQAALAAKKSAGVSLFHRTDDKCVTFLIGARQILGCSWPRPRPIAPRYSEQPGPA